MRGFNQTLSIYIVEDDDAVRDSLQALLETEGFAVRAFASAGEFLAGLSERNPGSDGRACVLLDLHMPGKGGQELLDTLASRDGDLTVVVMTGNADAKTETRALQSGASAFLDKPVDADRLIDLLRTMADETSGNS